MALDKFTQITKSGIVTTINFECHHLHSTGIATFSSGSISAVDGTFTGDVSIGGTLTYQDVTNIDSVGLVTARLGLNVTAGVSTFAALIDANGGVDISGGSGLVASTAKISDLTDNRVVIGGSSGELEDSANLTFDGSNLGVGSKVTVTNANADADNPNSLGAEINAAWIRLGDVTAAKSFSNGLGIKYYDQGTSHWSTGTIGNKFYISNTSNDGNKLFPSGRTDVVTCDTNGKVGVGTVTPGNTVHIGGTQGVGVRWHNYTSGNSAYHTLESGDKFQSNVGGSGEHGWVSAGGTKMTLTNAGRLGIGTAIPVGKFESYNTGLSTPTKTWGGGNPGQRLVNEGSELKIGLTAYSPYAYFLQANTSSGTDRQLTLNPMGGSVGIGLTNAQTDAGLVARYSNTHAPSLTWNTAGGHTLRNEGSELVFGLSNSSPHPYFLQARTSGNAAKQLVLNPLGGNVGIHETSPEEILDLGESNQQNLKLGQRGYLGQAYSTTATILGHSVKADTTNTVASQMMVTETNSGGGAPAAIRLVSGTIQFHTASSGTANAVFDSERLRIDSSGRLQMGSDPSNLGAAKFNIVTGGDDGISLGRLQGANVSSGDVLGTIAFQTAVGSQTTNSAEASIKAIAAENTTGSTAATNLSFYTKPTGTGPGSSPTERLKIWSTGTVGSFGARFLNYISSKNITGFAGGSSVQNYIVICAANQVDMRLSGTFHLARATGTSGVAITRIHVLATTRNANNSDSALGIAYNIESDTSESAYPGIVGKYVTLTYNSVSYFAIKLVATTGADLWGSFAQHCNFVGVGNNVDFFGLNSSSHTITSVSELTGREGTKTFFNSRIGISQSNPLHKLHVFDGSATNAAVLFDSAINSSALSGNTANNGYGHALCLENSQGTVGNIVSLGLQVRTGGSWANAAITAKALNTSGNADLSFWNESSNTIFERLIIKSNGSINFSNTTVATKNTSGDILIDFGNLTSNAGNAWRKCGVWILYNGIDTDATDNKSVVYYTGVGAVTTWNWVGDSDTMSNDSFNSVTLQNAATTGFRLYCDVNNQNTGTVFVMIHGWNTKPTITIN